jgi:DNA repair protein RecO (recombination protein O)
MRVSYATPAIVLRTRPYGDSDRIISFLTEHHGKITGIAKGAKRSRKRFVNSLEPLSLVQLRFQDRPNGNLVFILASDLLIGFQNLVSSLEKIAFASYLIEITDALIGEREENRLVFEHLKNALNFLQDQPGSFIFLTAFELKLLKLAGYQPSLERCRRCGKAQSAGPLVRWHFSPRDGGIFCQTCSQAQNDILPIGAGTLKALADLQQEESLFELTLSPPLPVLKEIRSIVRRFIRFHVDREIRSASFLDQFCAI